MEIFLTVRSRFWYVIKCTLCAAVILHHTCPKSGWKLRPKHSSVRWFVRWSVSSVRPSVRRNQTSSSLSLSLSPRARSLVALVLLLSLSRLARPPHLLYFLHLSCFRCYGFISVSSVRLLISIFFFVFFGPGLSSFVCFDAILVILRTQQQQQQ